MYERHILAEFPQEFQGFPKIEAFVRALGRQLDEVGEVLEQLKRLRCVDVAQGKQLDGVGDIVVLGRSDAMRLIKGRIRYDIIDDEHYRHFLKYKILKNTSTCNYYDMMAAVEMIFGVNDIEYFENPEEPATVTISFPEPEKEFDDIYPIKAAGVGLHIKLTKEINSAAKLFVGTVHTITAEVSAPPFSAIGSRRTASIKAGLARVEYVQLAARPFDGIIKREQSSRVVMGCGRTEFTEIKIPAYRRDVGI